MDEHPLIWIADGPAGPRPRVKGTGPDVWEVITTVRCNDGDPRAAADYLELPYEVVQAAVAYYEAHPDEIDEWIEENERMGEEAYASWLASQPDHVKREEQRRILDEMTADAEEAGMYEVAATPKRTR